MSNVFMTPLLNRCMRMFKFFHRCSFEFVEGSMRKNGNQDVDFALMFRPEYDATERCKCGKERTVQVLSYADKPSLKPIDGLRINL